VDDRLLEVNGLSLLGQSNIDAMETLRRAMHSAGPEPGSISIAVARPTAPPADAVAGVAMATNDAVGRTPCLRQTAASTGQQSRGLMPPPSTSKVLSTRKPRVCCVFASLLPSRLHQLALQTSRSQSINQLVNQCSCYLRVIKN